MVFSEEDKALIKNLYLIKGYGPQKLMSEFPGKNWKRRGLDELLRSCGKPVQLSGGRGVAGQNLHALKRTYQLCKSCLWVRKTNHKLTVPYAKFPERPAFHGRPCPVSFMMTLASSVLKSDARKSWPRRTGLFDCNAPKSFWICTRKTKWDFIWFTDEKVFTVAEWPFCTFRQLSRRSSHVAAERLLRTRTTFSRLWRCRCLKAWLHWSDICWSGGKNQWRLLSWCAAVTAAAANDAWRVGRVLSFFSQTALPRIERVTLSDFWNRRRRLSFHRICGHRINRSTTRSGHHAATRLPVACEQRWRTETAPAGRVARHGTEHHWQRNWRVALASSFVCEG